jgi:hypothetical protein
MSHISQLKLDLKNVNKKALEKGLKMLGVEAIESNIAIDYYGEQKQVPNALLSFKLGNYSFVVTKEGQIVGDFWQYHEDFIQNTIKTAMMIASVPGVKKVNAKVQGNGWEVEVDVDDTIYNQQQALGW